MTVNEFCSKIHLPSAVSHFGMSAAKAYHKIPGFGWYAETTNGEITFDCIELYRIHNLAPASLSDLMRNCYRYYVVERPELHETKINYSETLENKLVENFRHKMMHSRFYKVCRAEALDSTINYRGKNFKFVKLLDELGMPEFINSGIGLVTHKTLANREYAGLRLSEKMAGNILIPTFFGTNNQIASLELASLEDMSTKTMIYLNSEPGWYGTPGGNVVGGIRDLMTLPGCTWEKKVKYWVNNKVLKLHHSLQPSQCIEIWTNNENLATNVNPLTLIKTNNLESHIKDHIGNLTVQQIKELEAATGQKLHTHWLSLKTSEANISGIRFISRNERYYYMNGSRQYEYTNFIVELTRIKKEGEDFYQYGNILMNGQVAPFKAKRKKFTSQFRILEIITDALLEAGIGTPIIAPNIKHYLTNVIDAFNPVNIIEKPTQVLQIEASDCRLGEL